MSLNSNKIAIVEVGGSHDECILTQLLALHSRKKDILLICTKEVADRNDYFEKYATVVLVDSAEEKKKQANDIWSAIKASGASKVVFNTAQGAVVRNVCLKALFSDIEFIGIIHTTRKFEGSFTQKVINLKIKKYLVLSQFLHNKINAPAKIKIDYFYPIAFQHKKNIQSDASKIVLAILGGVEKRRKDLDGFLHMLEHLKNEKVEFVFIGKSNPEHVDVVEFKKQLAKGAASKVKLYDHFVSQDVFNEELAKASFILPLVHPETPSADQYFKNQISGATNVAFGYKIPLLIHEAYQHVEEMNSGSFYYNLENFDEVLQAAILNRKEKVKNLEQDFKVEEQQDRYLKFLFG